ncbi:MAG: 30S ribosomal protein S9 [Candidatus Wildermuthbacteria bacterium RIFCSPHIGHO2_12_FULL_45_9]|uniref:30S ribosomal protein S9 n=1 Tax=Candidatus Wildermuthbacteria bacterium RIFCSPHIGHO2_02_FULL_45_25 TaxID=1802450 RepID=A0A1G2QXC4_9BACT|nr:MAG: 30S ribosomal protein S9 [Candidatus Wildermuthbacteria bacterium RIFCSPHIGHO2_01_FULL_45_20]OHA65275.1 MAG: 30S ribosomal protein S9 [Candidatus Wildermuthbacteria bacterium RIFCSPHIGHO2_02_FULL_45_25]OHA71464.1 MAG: 30S ribosomal protein S9 [Candidatus Wildermuthbacteria bacterium RIFCSPHIGHO2_12_FULL_45_9]
MPVTPNKEQYVEAVGRRKTAIARVRLWQGKKKAFVVNEKPLEQYFGEREYQRIATEAVEKSSPDREMEVTVAVKGGGLHAQATAIRQGIARALEKIEAGLRPQLKALGFLTRDSRMRERKKFGKKRARRARQWRKR